jgi:hypothetical protein
VPRQRSVREAESTLTILIADRVDNTAAVQGPEPQVTDQNRYDRSSNNGRVWWKRLDPADVELLPGDNCRSRSFEVGAAVSDRDDWLVDILTGAGG